MDTPYLLLDAAIAKRNIARMAEKARASNVLFRPHFKTHQSAEVAQWYRAEGVEAITVSSLKMAQYFAANGWTDITLAFPVNRLDHQAIDALAATINFNIVVEDVDTIRFMEEKLTHPVGVYLKIDTGYGRTGVDAEDFDTLVLLMDALRETHNLIFIGLLTHAGHTYHAGSADEILEIQKKSFMQLRAIKTFLFDKFPLMQLSYGDTPSCSLMAGFSGVDEVRPGTFVFYDLTRVQLGVCSLAEVAVALISPVVAVHASRHEAVIHGGAVHLSKDQLVSADGTIHYGLVVAFDGEKWLVDQPLGTISRLSQEHGIISLNEAGESLLKPGMLVAVLPVHACMTANAMKSYVLTSGEILPMMP